LATLRVRRLRRVLGCRFLTQGSVWTSWGREPTQRAFRRSGRFGIANGALLIHKSPTHTQPSRSSARCCAFRPVRGAGSAHKAGKNLAISTAYAVRSSDNANRGRWPRIALGTGRAGRTGRANWSLRSRRAALASRSGRTLSASVALRALRSHGSRWTRWTGCTAFANWTLGADGVLADPVRPEDLLDRQDRRDRLGPRDRADLEAPDHRCTPPAQGTRRRRTYSASGAWIFPPA
jgi:hypothetical protein